jgi:hypothetical protein
LIEREAWLKGGARTAWPEKDAAVRAEDRARAEGTAMLPDPSLTLGLRERGGGHAG